MATSQLPNITTSAVGLEWILTWQNLQQHNVQLYKTIKCSGLTNLQHCPSVPRNSETEKERKTKGKIRENISLPLDPVTVFADSQGPPVVGAHLPTIASHIYTQKLQKAPPNLYNYSTYLMHIRYVARVGLSALAWGLS